VGAATVTGLVAGVVVGPLAGIRLTVHSGFGSARHVEQVGVAQVAVVSLLAGLAAWALLAVLERRTARPRRTWTVVAAVVLALSLAGPMSATSTTAGITLACLHVLVGSVLIFGLRGAASRAREERSGR
jgi:hypothetical protein